MNKSRPTISYDKESEVLSIELLKSKSVDSDIQGSMVVDYAKNDKIACVNFYDYNFDKFKSDLKALKEFSKRSDFLLSIK